MPVQSDNTSPNGRLQELFKIGGPVLPTNVPTNVPQKCRVQPEVEEFHRLLCKERTKKSTERSKMYLSRCISYVRDISSDMKTRDGKVRFPGEPGGLNKG